MNTVKVTNPEKYEKHKHQDARRKKEKYVSASDLGVYKQTEQRKKWNEAKKRERAKKTVRTESQTSEDNGKRWKDKNSEERKLYNNEKMKRSRMLRSQQKKSVDRKKDRITERECAEQVTG